MNSDGLYFEDDGSGPAVLFLHAFPLDLKMWAETAESCVSKGYRAVRIDLPGFGKSRKPMTSIAAAAEDVAAVIRELKLDTPFVCGLSMGGYVAFELLRNTTALFSGSILCDTVAAADSPEKRAERMATIQYAESERFAGFVDGFIESLIASRSLAMNPELPSVIRNGFERAGPEAISAAQNAMANRRTSEDILPFIKKPVCLIFGEDDPMNAAGKDLQHAIEGAEFHEVEKAGHFSNLENPIAFNSILLNFLDRVTIGKQNNYN